jgi:hypothetical protein
VDRVSGVRPELRSAHGGGAGAARDAGPGPGRAGRDPEIPRREPVPSDSTFTGPDETPSLAADVPVYAEAETLGSMSSERTGTIVNLRSDDPPEQVAGWYREELARRGWTLDRESATGAQHLVTALKEGRRATVLIKAGAVGTHILLTIARSG